MDADIHYGIGCKLCWETIDLTTLNKREVMDFFGEKRGRFVRDDWQNFQVICPHCNRNQFYLDKNVFQIGEFTETVKKLGVRMDKLERKFSDPHFKSDLAKTMLKQLAKSGAKKPESSTENPLAR